MPKKKKPAKPIRGRSKKQAMADGKKALAAHKKLELELKKVKKHLSGLMSSYWNWGA